MNAGILWNKMAALSSAIQIAREFAGADVNGLTNTVAIDFSNAAAAKMRKMLIDQGVDAAPVQEAVRSITDGVGTYLYPSDMFYVPKYIELDWFDSVVTTAHYIQLDKVKESNVLPNQGLGWLRINQPSANPLVDYRGDYFEILPTPQASFWGGASGSSLSNALRIFYYVNNVVYTSTADTLTYPESIDYFSFGTLLRDMYFYSLGNLTKDELEKSFQYEVGKIISMTKGDGPSPTRPKQISVTGFEF